MPRRPILRAPGARTLAALVLVSGIAGINGIAGPQSASADPDYAEAMAREHAADDPRPSPAAAKGSATTVEATKVRYAELGAKGVDGYLARTSGAAKELPGVVMIHEWWGLNENVRSMARQLAGEGYSVLAVDLYGGKTGQTPEAARALMQGVLGDPEGVQQNLRQARDFLAGQGASRVGSIGWCLGGGVSLAAGITMGNDLDAVVMYYGRPVADKKRLAELRAPLLGLFGAEDTGIPVASVRALESTLEELGKEAEIHVYPGAGHAFANPSGTRYQPQAAEDAWRRTLAFFQLHLQR